MKRRTLISAGIVGGVVAGADEGFARELRQRAPDLGQVVRGPLQICTSGGTVQITNGSDPFATHAVLHVENLGDISCGIRSTCYWTGSDENVYDNHDSSLFEVFNNVTSSSRNRSWAGSFANAWNNIPAGVTDNGTRVGVLGWATSVNAFGYKHSGTLAEQVGVLGKAGFQGVGSDPSALIVEAAGVRGIVINDSEGSTIAHAIAGQFVSASTIGTVERNIAVYASAKNGQTYNYSFYGNSGELYQQDNAVFGAKLKAGEGQAQSDARVAVRTAGNSLEFGHPDPAGYASTLGSTSPAGMPFLAFCAEADPYNNTFTTRSKQGTVLYNDLSGALIISHIRGMNSQGQLPIERARIDEEGHLVLAETLRLKKQTPESSKSTGKAGEICWDEDYVYICVTQNTWKRLPLSVW